MNNKIIACFDEHSSNVYGELLKLITATNVGVFSGRRAGFNNNPLLILENESVSFADKVNLPALLRRILIGIIVNDAPVSDAPTHILVIANGDSQDAISIDANEYEDISKEFANRDIPLPLVEFISSGSSDLESRVQGLIGTVREVVVGVPLDEPVEPVQEAVVEVPVVEPVETEQPVVTKNKRKK